MPSFRNPVVSILLPFYKPGKKLDHAISSIVEQTFTKWELVLINNNACELSAAIARKWAGKDQRIMLIHEPAQGVAHAMNTGLRHASADLVARMDADDISFPARIGKQVEYLAGHPGTGVVSTQSKFFSTAERSKGFSFFVDWQNSIITDQQHYLSCFIESPLAQPTVMFRKKLIDLYGFYKTENLPEDYELWLRWFDNGIGFYKIPEPLVQWNDHDERLTRTHPDYSEEAFLKVRYEYLARWLKKEIIPGKKIIVCGSSRNIVRKAEYLLQHGVNFYGFTDVKPRKPAGFNFIPYRDINDPSEYFILNLISKRGVGKAIKDHFAALGFIEGKDLILAG